MMLASRLHMFGGNLFLLIGTLILSVVAIFLLLAVWTAIKMWIWKRGQKRAQEQYENNRCAEDGTQLPATSRGICTDCGRVQEKVFHLPDGKRLCPTHYREQRANQQTC
ncbi:MAG: hypothetical protein GXP29_05750 [Planctomycetes bacterium]|nr:hypothetical protein [Planctomycetota bacterium]